MDIPLYGAPAGRRTLWATGENPGALRGRSGMSNRGAKGMAFVRVPPGGGVDLLNWEGAGIVRRIGLTIRDRTPAMLRGLRIDIWWDGAATPAVSAPLGDFFGHGLGRMAAFESELFSSPEGRNFLCAAPMPFARHARIAITNETADWVTHLFYEVNFEALDAPLPDARHFHAHWRRERLNQLGGNYTILPRVEGSGRFLGLHAGVMVNPAYGDSWWGEGEVKMWLDGDGEWPTLCATGWEDYLGTSWGLRGFNRRFLGCPLADKDNGLYHGYRWHMPDPVWFENECRVTVQTIGGAPLATARALRAAGVELWPVSLDDGKLPEGVHQWWESEAAGRAFDDPGITEGWVNFWRRDDWSSTAYFYLDRPENGLPPLPPAAERRAAPLWGAAL